MSGKLLVKKEAVKGTVTINTSSFGNGMYTLRVLESGTNIKNFKILIQH